MGHKLNDSLQKPAKTQMTEDTRIPTNLRMLRLLEVLGRSDRSMSAADLTAHLGLPKQTVHRLCNTLVEEGFLTRPMDGKRFSPGRRARELGSGLLFTSRSHIARHQILQDIAREVRETVNFVVPEPTGMSYLDRVETDWPFRVQLPVGSNVPFHCTASGKTFMASLSPTRRSAFVSSLTLTALTNRTLTDTDALLSDLDQIKRRGYALDQEEFVEGMIAIAVPVRDPQGRFIAALAFHGPAQRLSIETAISKKDVLKTGADRLTGALFG